MKRVIVDFKKLNQELLEMLVTKFPNGYDDTDIITFRNASYELIEAVEVKTDDTTYLIKISKRLADTMEKFDVNSDDDDDDDDESLKEKDDEILSANTDMDDDLDDDFEDEIDDDDL
ncbi:hypothetical protein [Lutimonas vermicola]|uniref:DNA primase n=1 Tax=Lutimonas vermicola TaxID=414288 RepID=A0ABU9L0N3_9FLAO